MTKLTKPIIAFYRQDPAFVTQCALFILVWVGLHMLMHHLDRTIKAANPGPQTSAEVSPCR